VSLTWVIAGGGTGGHFFSGVAIAEAAWARDPDHRIVFVGTENGIEGRTHERQRLDIRYITVSGLKGKSLARRALTMVQLPVALGQSLALLTRVKPDVVIGVGGYASGPLLLAAWMTGTPTAVMEQNSVPGYTNSVLARIVDRIFVGFPEAAEHFPAGKTVHTGNPIRQAMLERLGGMEEAPAEDGFHLLVFGGSQGAHHLNGAMVAAAPRLARESEASLRIVHQTGPADLDDVAAGYREAGLEDRVEVLPFIDDMASAYHRADLVVCRAGAMTVAELTACGKPAILVPFPYAIYDHQEINARSLSDRGAARLLLDGEMDGETLATAIAELTPDVLGEMAERAADLARPGAGDDVTRQCEELALRRRR